MSSDPVTLSGLSKGVKQVFHTVTLPTSRAERPLLEDDLIVLANLTGKLPLEDTHENHSSAEALLPLPTRYYSVILDQAMGCLLRLSTD